MIPPWTIRPFVLLFHEAHQSHIDRKSVEPSRPAQIVESIPRDCCVAQPSTGKQEDRAERESQPESSHHENLLIKEVDLGKAAV